MVHWAVHGRRRLGAQRLYKNRERLIKYDAIIELFNLMLEQPEDKGLLSGEHFSVDGTLIQAWAGHKSFVRKDGSEDDADSANFKDQSRWLCRTRSGQGDDQRRPAGRRQHAGRNH